MAKPHVNWNHGAEGSAPHPPTQTASPGSESPARAKSGRQSLLWRLFTHSGLGTLWTFHSLEISFHLSRRKENIYRAPTITHRLVSTADTSGQGGFIVALSRSELVPLFAQKDVEPRVFKQFRSVRARIWVVSHCCTSPEATLQTLLGHVRRNVSVLLVAGKLLWSCATIGEIKFCAYPLAAVHLLLYN